MKSFTPLAGLAAIAPSLVSAHGFVNGVRVNGAWSNGADPVWFYNPENAAPNSGWNSLNQDLGFVEPASFGTSDIACHKSAIVGEEFVDVNAGDTMEIYWNTWPDSHKGPIIDYLSPFASDAASLSFTKIQQGAIVSGETWVTDELIANNFTTTLNIPSNLAAGEYVLRHEIIALHGAGSDNGAQAYPQCLNLRVGGSGSVALPGGTAGSSLYTRSDPGILFNLYSAPTEYPFPGPELWTGAN